MGFVKTLSAALAVAVLMGSAPAEARFGKRSRPSTSDAKDSDDRDDGRKEHRATPVGRASDAPVRSSVRASGAGLGWFDVLFISGPASYHRRARAEVPRGQRAPRPAPLVHLNLQGNSFGDVGGALDLFMALDGQRWGMDARVSGLSLEPDDGSSDRDRLTLLDAHLTLSPWSTERGRFRMEAGIASAHAPDAIFVGPSLAASLEACLGPSPFDVEARIQVVPFPHRQVDMQAGLALHLGALNLRGGWRTLFLSDGGHLDGVVHSDSFTGPYLGLGLSF
ncbi:hypothetical protein D7X55_30730 [Corallococcus sp. AB049A]|uniref:DUF481 domain-containing protein n=1 Tax=Corallococcus interemptor TaxID=2316720 RepID=A0A3A8PXK8_9BACT|nr:MULTISPECIES: hypothetical protein [Corallococcus]RKH61149.1 hypothetical protein D7X96_32255 [Corallococcus interemptor]RKI53922.1 hypothetical protein D7X55_30730 [Corallococcus sp. AB049A]